MKHNPIINIQIPGREIPMTISCEEKESILAAMLRNGLSYRADCGGRGTCGKCRVKVLLGELAITTQDKKIFTEAELRQGMRLACKAYPVNDCNIVLITGEETGFEVVMDHIHFVSAQIRQLDNKPDDVNDKAFSSTGSSKSEMDDQEKYFIAIDLGTTTIALSLVGAKDGRIVRSNSTVNPQRVYGADVISRMRASIEGKREFLKDLIRGELYEGMKALLTEVGMDWERIDRVAIAGNTTMGHLLMGYPCNTLGVFPFTPYRIDEIEVKFSELFPERLKIPVVLLPGISVFVGGDIIAGLYFCGFHEAEKPCLLIDLGTNGEMAIGNKDKLLVTSTAAGPAFEGGNISCGVGSVSGAISQVTLIEDEVRYQTIGGKPPIGICGTGVIEIVSELYKTGRMDDTGLLSEPYFEEGFPIADLHFIQKDIREFQLAKAAIHAGVEILLKNYGITQEQLDKVYLAGGFGYKMNVEKAIHIGLFPKELKKKIEAVGNTSLAGTMKYLTHPYAKGSVEELCSKAKEIHLSNDEDFYDLYLQRMSF